MKKHDMKSKILLTIGLEEIHGYELHKDFAFRGSKISQSRLYSILSDMVAEGILIERWVNSAQGPRKKLFSLSESGLELRTGQLIDAVNTVHRFYMEYLGTLPGESNFFDQIWSTIEKKIPKNPRVAIIVGHMNQQLRYLLSLFHNHFSNGDFYLLKNPNIELENINEEWMVLNGIYDNIPLKDEYLDLLVTFGFHKTYANSDVFQEWHRMIKKNGTLAIMTSVIQTSEPITPLPLGNYIELYQHQSHGSHEDWKVFKKLISDQGMKINETTMAEICILQAVKKL
ncbi:MAG: helix-turn-helix transcriptional regulator [Candidatus Thorarchaeota archaeon]|jgi:DNA-binding PadR family transcriptional regulator